MNIDLTRFTEKDGRPRLAYPWRHDGFVYATNGYVAVRVLDEAGIEAVDAFAAGTVAERAKRFFYEHCPSDVNAYEPFQLPLPEPNQCEKCDGTGRMEQCDECNGEGFHTHGRHEYECKECCGLGGYSYKNEIGEFPTVDCWECRGTGEAPSQFIQLGTLHFNRRYLAALAHFEGRRFRISSPSAVIDAPYTTQEVAAFHFNGGHAIVMPVRV